DFGLPAALRWWAGELARRAPLQVHLAGEDALPRLPGEMEAQLFRIAQEAMMNIVKHASATRIDIALSSAQGRVRLRIEDNGRGFDPGGHDPLLRRPSWGLVHMRERALAIDGELRIESRPDAGTRVEVEAPLP
ncbi:MAG TPA: ATP-binding protein, partial [Arenimonas sp.]|nr:ATP-binding protein [Arenimonas sp.]